ncbi:MAG: phage head-tail adapter protein [Ruminococcus sp.]|nr:phage head-tail adapter protein [Ruminococcus sp.]
MQTSRLFTLLPEEYVCTPDGMEIDKNGDLIVSCPNYADDHMSGCVIRIDKEKQISKWFDVPVHPETGLARNMGIAFDADWNMYICDNQGWSGKPEMAWKGRILKIEFDEERKMTGWKTVAYGMEHPNGIRVIHNYMYLTQSYLTKEKDASGGLVSCVYRFPLDAENIEITNTMADDHILTTFVTHNPDCQYGVDGIETDSEGNLYIGNYGDGEVWKVILDEKGDYVSKELYAKNPEELNSTDGMILDESTGNLYIADFNKNAIVMVDKHRKVRRIAQSPDCTGFNGELDQPGEPIIWQGKIVASCFDLVTDAGKINTAHEMPATMAELDLEPEAE